MSSFLVLPAVSALLRRTLWDAFAGDPVIQGILPSESAIVFTNPTETARNPSNRLSVWLYQITENEFVRNQPPSRGKGALNKPFSPPALNLYYLLTPFAGSSENELMLLGRAMQTMYDQPILHLQQDAGEEINEELRIIHSHLSLEELTRIWEALREPYRLSAAYQVLVTHIGAERSSSRGENTSSEENLNR